MEHVRCGHCRNPIRLRQAEFWHGATEKSYHLDCWSDLHSDVQRSYVERVRNAGLDGLLGPYTRLEDVPWLPEQRGDDEALEDFAELDGLGALEGTVGESLEGLDDTALAQLRQLTELGREASGRDDQAVA